MSGSTDYCNQFELTKQSSATTAQESSEAGRYSILPDQSLRPARTTPALHHNTWNEKKCDLSLPEETYEQLDPAPVRGGEGGATLKGEDRGEFAAYTFMRAAPVRLPPGPPLPPTPHQQGLRFGGHGVQAPVFNGSDFDTVCSKKTGASLVRTKRAVFILGLCVALFLLVSSAALALGVLNLIQVPESDKQAGAFAANNSQQVGGGGGEDIAARVRILEESLDQLQARFQLQSNMGGANETAISTLSSKVDQLGSQLSAVNGSLASQGSSVNARFNSISSQLNNTSASLASLSARVNSRVELYRGCYKDSSTCRVVQHASNAFWYLCNTPFLLLNVTVRTYFSHAKQSNLVSYSLNGEPLS